MRLQPRSNPPPYHLSSANNPLILPLRPANSVECADVRATNPSIRVARPDRAWPSETGINWTYTRVQRARLRPGALSVVVALGVAIYKIESLPSFLIIRCSYICARETRI
jgi:hypothetical protein